MIKPWVRRPELVGPYDPRSKAVWRGPLPTLTAQERAALALRPEDVYVQRTIHLTEDEAQPVELEATERRSIGNPAAAWNRHVVRNVKGKANARISRKEVKG